MTCVDPWDLCRPLGPVETGGTGRAHLTCETLGSVGSVGPLGPKGPMTPIGQNDMIKLTVHVTIVASLVRRIDEEVFITRK